MALKRRGKIKDIFRSWPAEDYDYSKSNYVVALLLDFASKPVNQQCLSQIMSEIQKTFRKTSYGYPNIIETNHRTNKQTNKQNKETQHPKTNQNKQTKKNKQTNKHINNISAKSSQNFKKLLGKHPMGIPK